MKAVERNASATDERPVERQSGARHATVDASAARHGLAMEKMLLRRILADLGDPPFEFVLWTGERVAGSARESIGRLHIADRATIFGLITDPDLQFGDAYSEGRIEIEGNVTDFLEALYRSMTKSAASGSTLQRLAKRLRRPRSNTLTGSRANIHHHYDIGNEFYSLWLGDTMAYTCAYYPVPEVTLDEAQTAKMHHVCRKLRLRAGESVVEAGCGWGTFALHMAHHYGVRVRAFNISTEQVAYARERAKIEGLADRVEYIQDDYRNITGTYDAFVSVGMLEHVGTQNYRELGRIASQSIGDSGRGLIHSIGRNRPGRLHPWIEKRVFPGAYPPSLGEMMGIFEPWNLSVLDVENLRLHYAQTLRHWLELFEASSERIERMFDSRFVRMWRLYLAGSTAAFLTGTLQLFQVVFAPGSSNAIPWTRAGLYSERA